MAISEDLVDQHRLLGSYQNVKRFIRRLARNPIARSSRCDLIALVKIMASSALWQEAAEI